MDFPLPMNCQPLEKKQASKQKWTNYKISYLFLVVPEYNLWSSNQAKD